LAVPDDDGYALRGKSRQEAAAWAPFTPTETLTAWRSAPWKQRRVSTPAMLLIEPIR
jgi:hypothetical protein